MKNYENFENFKEDIENIWSLIKKTKVNPGFSLPLDNDEDQFKSLAESLLFVSEKRTEYIDLLEGYFKSEDFKKKYMAVLRSSTQVERVRILHDELNNAEFDNIIVPDNYLLALRALCAKLKDYLNHKSHSKYKALLDNEMEDILGWDLVPETDDELLKITIKNFQAISTGLFGAEHNPDFQKHYKQPTVDGEQGKGEIIKNLSDGLDDFSEDSLEDLIARTKKMNIPGSYAPLALRPFFLNNLILFSNAPYEYFPFDNKVGDYFKENLSGFMHETFEITDSFLNIDIAKLVDEKKVELSKKFYDECRYHLYTISEVQWCSRNNNKNNIDITNALKVCYEIMKGYEKSASIIYTRKDSVRDVISTLVGNVDSHIKDSHTDYDYYKFYKMGFIKDGYGKILGNPLKSNDYSYGEIIEEIKLELQYELLDYGFENTQEPFINMLENDIFNNKKNIGNSNTAENARRKLSTILVDDIVSELEQLEDDEVKQLNKWIRFEFIDFFEPEIAKYESVRKNEIKEQPNLSLIQSVIEKLHNFEGIEEKLDKARKKFKIFYEKEEENFSRLRDSTWYGTDIDIPEFRNKFHKIFSKNIRQFGRSIDFFLDESAADPHRSKDFFEPYDKKIIKKVEKIISTIKKHLNLKSTEAYKKLSSNEKSKLDNKNVQNANKHLTKENKKFLQDWLIAEHQLSHIDNALTQLDWQEVLDKTKSILPKTKKEDIYGNKIIIELPNYRKIHLLSANFFNSTKDYYEIDKNEDIKNKKINNIKKLIERLLELIQLQPKMAGLLLKDLTTDQTRSSREIRDVLDIFKTYIMFKTRTLCEVYIAECIDPVARAGLFLNGINPIQSSDVKNTYDILIKDLNRPIKLFQTYFEYIKQDNIPDYSMLEEEKCEIEDNEVTLPSESEWRYMTKKQISERAKKLDFESVNISQTRHEMIENLKNETNDFLLNLDWFDSDSYHNLYHRPSFGSLLPSPVTKKLVIWEIVDSLQDLQKYLILMRSFDINNFGSKLNTGIHPELFKRDKLKKQKGLSDHELTVLAKKIRKYKADSPKAIKKAIDKYANFKESNSTKFIRDQRDILRKPIRDRFLESKKAYETGKINSVQFNKAKVKFEDAIKKIKHKKKKSLLHKKAKNGGTDRDSAIKWLKNRPGNFSKLKDLHHYADLSKNIGFYEFRVICKNNIENIQSRYKDTL